ncbi:MAG TPA: hypothetical protein VL860_13220 [Planctomycetota bacterium]|nr:hypothetical protein [Planctomycetota bacterium]
MNRSIRCPGLALTCALGLAGLWLAGCEPHERTTGERMQDLMDDHDRDMAGFDGTGASTRSGTGASARGPSGEILNWRVTVTNYTVEEDTRDGLGVLWKYTDANVKIAGGMAPRESGLRLGFAGANFQAELDAQSKNAQMSSKTQSMLVVMKSHTGVLTVGQTRFVPAFIYDGRTLGGVLMKTEAVQSLVVRPEITADGLVELSLTPQFSRIEGYNDIVLTEMTTTVLLKPGVNLVIGGNEGAENQVAASLFSHTRGTKTGKTLLVVRVDGM